MGKGLQNIEENDIKKLELPKKKDPIQTIWHGEVGEILTLKPENIDHLLYNQFKVTYSCGKKMITYINTMPSKKLYTRTEKHENRKSPII